MDIFLFLFITLKLSKKLSGVANMKLSKIVGKRTQELLFKNNMTQYRLVKITCLNEKTISDLIKGKTSDVNITTIFAIAKAFNMTLSEFFSDEKFDDEEVEG